jgi:hypothetical protein
MADTDKIVYDEDGHPRHFDFGPGEAGLTGATPQETAKTFLMSHADVLKVPTDAMRSLELRAAIAPTDETESLRFESETRLMDSTTVSYTQTMFGLPIYQAGVSVTMHGPDNRLKAATSTLHYDVAAKPPAAAMRGSLQNAATTGGYDDLVRKAIRAAKDMRINRTRLMVYRYISADRIHKHRTGKSEDTFATEPPTLRLPPVPKSIKNRKHYVVVEALFSSPMRGWGLLNWRAFIEPESGAVLYLRALTDGITGLVFNVDPMTKTNNSANLPSAVSATLDVLRDNVALVNLGAPVGNPLTQNLAGSFVQLADRTAPSPNVPTTTTPFNFAYVSRTDDFAAVNAYYHCDRFFRMVQDTGFNIASYFDHTAFPVPVDHRGMGSAINAQCPGNALGNGIGFVQFALADLGSTPIGIACDWRVVLHELGGHGILWDHVDSPNFGFSHSAGDSIAVILNDPDTHIPAPDRFISFPWVNIGRRHDRPVNGWGWGSANDNGGYGSEQILATCHFRLYRSIGGDSTYGSRRLFAARSAVYLILRGVGQLTPSTNPGSPLGWEQQLETADAGVWTSTNPAEVHAGGAYHKVIRWAFEKQGVFRAPGASVTVEGKPPAVDVYIDDGRKGEYPFQPNHWSCTDIWNRTTSGAGGGVHQQPVVGQTNFAYVRIKNRGTQSAKNVLVKGFHCLPGVGLEFPTDWVPMTTPQLAAANLAAGDSVGVVVGPFQWTPSQVGHECMFFSVSAAGDAGNIDGHVVGPIPEWRLVPHDNNIGQRNVHPVSIELLESGWEKLPFWIHNHGTMTVQLGVDVTLPKWLVELGWKFDVPKLTRGATLKPGQELEVTVSAASGSPFDDQELARQRDRDIVVTVLQDGLPIGGMTWQVSPRKKPGVTRKARSKKGRR